MNIFNVSLQSAIFPNDWKFAEVIQKQTAEITDQYLVFQLWPNFSKICVPAAKFVSEVEWHSCGAALWFPSSTFYWNLRVELARTKMRVGLASRDSLIKMYNALVWPHFNYCSTIWNDGCYTITNKLFKLQKRAARIW